jgi:hypothetical protein
VAFRKAGNKNKLIHFSIPGSRSLLGAIEGFLEATNKILLTLNKSRRSFHINFLLQIAMQKGVFYVHLMDFP